MKTFHIAVRTALLCSLLWIGGTALLINEYIKVVQTKDFQIMMLKSDVSKNKQLITVYDTTLKDFLWRIQNREEIRLAKKTFMCYKIDKV